MSETLNDTFRPDQRLAAALAAAQGEMSNAAFNADNPAFKGTRYANSRSHPRCAPFRTCPSTALSISAQITDVNTTECCCTTRLLHMQRPVGGEPIYPHPGERSPAHHGQRDHLCQALFVGGNPGIAGEKDDDDGNAAQDAVRRTATPPIHFSPNASARVSAQAKRDGDWQTLEQALADAQSAREVERLREEWVRDWYPAWKDDWRDSATEEFDKRLAEFSQPGALKQTLKDSIEAAALADASTTDEQVAKYHECWEWLEGATTLNDLVMRADNAGFRGRASRR